MNKVLIFSEQVFTVAAVMIYSGAILTLILSGGMQENEFVDFDSSLIQIINLLLYIVTIFLLVLRWRKTFYFLTLDRWITPLVLLSAVSILWSFEPGTTLKDSITMIGSSLFGLYLASRYTLKRQLELLTWAFVIMVVLSFIFAVALPKYGIMGSIHQGKWRGVFLHKNGLGARMVYSSLLFLILGYESKKHSLLMWAGLALSVLLMLLSASSSSLLNLAIIIFMFFVSQTVRLPYLVMLPVLTMIITIGELFYFWLINNANLLFASIGKDATLTGRTDLWPLVIEMIWKHPWLGYGYGGFWRGWNSEAAYIWRASGWTPTHPHNGFLALWLDLGLLGLGLFVLGLWRAIVQGLHWLRVSKTSINTYPILYITFLVISNLTESNLYASNSLTWILYVSTSFAVSQKLNELVKNPSLNYQSIDE
ncbi:MAG: O-antigen ligase family protein [Dolichospermum sp. DET50]|nr:O-antigen ligase family protein [Dolichospermum sp. DET66]MBS3032909.1 O-antigen ligase family protein [Dolichospermum sp. DET67]MBS3038114.1 O-antigen ligase family protein [Dolichospermum sp. DET50]QSX70018.1 MAG: O-antigen ligase family protein [Dolichospermum sp. DET69]